MQRPARTSETAVPKPVLAPVVDGNVQFVAPLASALRDCRILIVDDSPLACMMIHSVLQKAGFQHFVSVHGGEEALLAVGEFRPDLIVLDVQMPGIDGFEVCSRLREERSTADIPILFQTGSMEADIRARAFEVGANDVVTKPLQPRELVARARIQLENRILLRDLSQHFERLEQELDSAYKMQSILQPSQHDLDQIEQCYAVEIDYFADASSELGGDIWGIWPVDHDKLAFYMADFSGHGVVAALNVFRLHTLIQEHAAKIEDPKNFLSYLNAMLAKVLPTGQYATMIAGYVDMAQNQLHYAAAAAPRAIVIRDGGKEEPQAIDTAGLPLGISLQAIYENREVPFSPDDYLLLYSDALIESPGWQDPPLEEEGLLSLVTSFSESDGFANLAERCLTQFFEQTRTPLPDDLTVVGIHRPPRPNRNGTAGDVDMFQVGLPPAPVAMAIGDSTFHSCVRTMMPILPRMELRPLSLADASVEAVAAVDGLPAALLLQTGTDSGAIQSLIEGIVADEELCHLPLILIADSDQKNGGASVAVPPELHREAFRVLDLTTREDELRVALQAALDSKTLLDRLSETDIESGAPLPPMKGQTEFRTINQAHRLARLLSKACPDPNTAVIGFTELLINAVEHGNLEITFDDKTRLLETGNWTQEVERRQALPRYRHRRAVVALDCDGERLRIVIRDDGKGFDAEPFLEFDPKRLVASHGRGIALARTMAFDSFEYRGCGNEVEITLLLCEED